jgi:DNA-binding CsgD family transcriptional regulator
MKIAAFVAYHTIIPLVRSQVGPDRVVHPLLASYDHSTVAEEIQTHEIDTLLITSLATSQWLAFEQSVDPVLPSSLVRIVLSRQEPFLLGDAARLLGLDGVVQIDGEESPLERIERIVDRASQHGNNFDPAPRDPALTRRLLSLFSISYTDEMDFEIALRIATGATDREIARDVFLSTKTVRNRISGLLTRSGCRNRTELALMQVHSPYTSWATYLAIQAGEISATQAILPGEAST